MKNAILLFIILLLGFGYTQAQDPKVISGKVIDETNEGIPYAAVSLFSQLDSTLIRGTVTDIEGQFDVNADPGIYYLQISFLSFEDIVINGIEIKNESIDLGTQTMTIASAYLDEVLVQAERSTMELQLDKKVFNVGKDLSAGGKNAADILDRVPSVSVDVEGNVSLRGSGNVRILINGKPSGLVNAGDPQSLRQLQGSLIQSIEVITNPSAKYDAEGEAGILNIILKKEVKKGVNGSFDLFAGYPHDYGGAFNLNYRSEHVNFFISEGVSWERNPGKGNTFQQYFFNDTTYAYQRYLTQSRSDLSNNFRLGADFYITPKDIITLSGLYQYSTGKNLSDRTYTDFNSLEEQTGVVTRTQDELEIEHTVEFDLSYKKDFEKKGQKFTMDVKFNLSQDEEDAEYEEDDQNTIEAVDVFQRSDNLEYEKTWLFQTDYVHPFGNKGKIETGFKANLRDFNNDYKVEEQNSGGEWEVLDGFLNEFLYQEKIYAAYLSAGEEWGNFSAKAGLRMEYSDIKTELVVSEEENPRSYVDFFPSAFLAYKIKEKNTIQLGYSRRISRPGFWSLLPFFQYADSRNYWSGNPDLNPEYSNSFELGYQRYLEKGSFLATIFYRYKTNIIQRVTFVEDSGVQRTFPINLSSSNNYGYRILFEL